MMRLFHFLKLTARKLYVELLLKVLTWLGKNAIQVRLQSGQRLVVRVNDLAVSQLLEGETFEKGMREKIFADVKPGMVVLDIGGNIGYYTVQLSPLVGPTGKVVVFEPNPTMIRELQRNVELNRLSNVIVQPVALSDQAGEAEFHCPPSGWEGHGSLRPNMTFQTIGKITVPTRRLDDVLEELKITSVDLIKIDVEGAEWGIFKGSPHLLSAARKPMIYFECAEITCREFGHSVLDVLRDLSDRDYHIEQIDYGIWCARPRLDNARKMAEA
ncbi:MAG TPA: FkbM family methyltransferase [Candidatus Eisenbacteria bacterium]|nr:FkbM family methyltransferase [Candidatus Eisenbacteria bacterium]